MTAGDEFAAVIEAAKVGQEWAFDILYTDLHPFLLRYLKAQEPRAADDIAADTCLAAVQRLARFEGDQRGWKAWMFTIARNRLADYRRTNARHKTFPVASDTLEGYASTDPELADPCDIAVEKLAAGDAIDLVARVLRPEQAEVLLLRVLGGFSVAETAELMRKRPGTVRVLQHRALQHLQKALSNPGRSKSKSSGNEFFGDV